MIKRHYKKPGIDNEKKGKREVREMQQIFNGTLLKNPEYIKRKQYKKSKMLGLTSRSPMSINNTNSRNMGRTLGGTL